jgi:hypothetical protein
MKYVYKGFTAKNRSATKKAQVAEIRRPETKAFGGGKTLNIGEKAYYQKRWDAECKKRVDDIEESLNLIDSHRYVGDVLFTKGEPTEIDYSGMDQREEDRLHAKVDALVAAKVLHRYVEPEEKKPEPPTAKAAKGK